MRPRLVLVALAATLVTALVSPPPSLAAPGDGPFAVSGGRLTAGGAPYTLSGLNMYNANSDGTCGPNMATSIGTALAGLGPDLTVLRAWFFQDMATSAGVRDWTAFDRTLAAAAAHDMVVIPVLGNQWADCDTGYGFKANAWYASGYKLPDPAGTVSYSAWVQEFSARYGNDPRVLAIELLNEPETSTAPWPAGSCPAGAADLLRAWAADVSAAAKAAGAGLVSLGTLGGGQCGSANDDYRTLHALPAVDLCSYHDYSPIQDVPGDQWNGMAVRLAQCAALGKPLYVGEAGIKPDQLPQPSLAARADRFRAKLHAQVAAGSTGLVAWAWGPASTLDNYDIGSGDPSLDALRVPYLSVLTPAGAATTVSLHAGSGTTVDVTAAVGTTGWSRAVLATSPAPPAGYQVGPGLLLDVSTTAQLAAPVTVCVTYPATAVADPARARLLHHFGGAWADVTTAVDAAARRVCGQVSALGPVAVGTPSQPVRFAPPVDPEALNVAKAGSAIPVKFSLGGFQGYDIFTAGSPSSRTASCPDSPSDAVETTVTASANSLTYDPATDLYNFVWKTTKSWRGCRTLTLDFTGPYLAPPLQFRFL